MKQTLRMAILSIGLAISTPAIAGLHQDFFQASGANSEDGIQSKAPPQVFTTNDLDVDVQRLREDGYFVLGMSSWLGATEDAKATAKFAKKIKASVALVQYRYIDTVSGGTQVVMMPVVGGYGGMIGGARPVSYDRYRQTTYFFAKIKPEKIGLGLWFENLTPVQAKALGSSKGLSITTVVRGSPGFDAGMIAGDVILTLAGQDISTPDRLERVKTEYAGQTAPVEIYRDGQVRTLQIAVPAAPTAKAGR